MDEKRQDCGCCGQAAAGLSRRDALARLGYSALGLAGLSTLAGCPGGSTYGRETADAGAAGAAEQSLQFDKRKCRVGSPLSVELGGVKIIVARNKNTGDTPGWVAADQRCTHNRCNVAFDSEANGFVCPCHGSRFSFTGEPVSGPARQPLATYRIEEGPINLTVYNEQVPALKTGMRNLDQPGAGPADGIPLPAPRRRGG